MSQDKRIDLKREDVRLGTFNGRWPKDFIDTKEHTKLDSFLLASDQVLCAFCTGVVGNWKEGGLPVDEHRRNFEMCPFYCSRSL